MNTPHNAHESEETPIVLQIAGRFAWEYIKKALHFVSNCPFGILAHELTNRQAPSFCF